MIHPMDGNMRFDAVVTNPPDTDIVRHHIEDELPDFYRIRH